MVCVNQFRGRESIELKTENVQVIWLPYGGKMVSLRNLKNDVEWLWQGEGTHPQSAYGADYAEEDLSGFDDMFPSINACYYPDHPWAGTPMPDHGELWAIPWEYTLEEDAVSMQVHGVRMPYRFCKRMHFTSQNTLRTDYRIENLSNFPMPFIWAAHPLFNIEAGGRIVLPADSESIITTVDFNSRLGQAGSIHAWPVASGRDGQPWDISEISPPRSGNCEKFYVNGPLKEGRAELKCPHMGSLRFDFPIEQVPYLGLWLNYGGLKDQHNVALEPATGALDDIYASKMFGRNSTLAPRGVYEFSLDITIE